MAGVVTGSKPSPRRRLGHRNPSSSSTSSMSSATSHRDSEVGSPPGITPPRSPIQSRRPAVSGMNRPLASSLKKKLSAISLGSSKVESHSAPTENSSDGKVKADLPPTLPPRSYTLDNNMQKPRRPRNSSISSSHSNSSIESGKHRTHSFSSSESSTDSEMTTTTFLRPQPSLLSVSDSMSIPPVQIPSDSTFWSNQTQNDGDKGLIDLSHEDAPWYHGDLLRSEAKMLLQHHGGSNGLFLIRDNTRKPGCFVLSIMFNREMLNYQIKHTYEDRVSSYCLATGGRFISLSELLVRSGSGGGLLPCSLTSYAVKRHSSSG